MDHVLLAQVLQGLQDLDRKSADQAERHAHEVVPFDEFVQVDAEQLEGDQ